MLPTLLRRLAALSAIVVMASPAIAEPAIVAKARAYVGSEAALNAVKSVHYVGTMSGTSLTDPSKPVTVAVDIIFQAPYRQRTLTTSSAAVDTSGLDGYDGWHRLQDVKDPNRWRMQLLTAEQIKRQRATVWENLSFYRGLEQEGGSELDQGIVTIAGVACRKIAFVHADNVIFYRYFDEATGRLVQTETETGSSIREQGEIIVNGIRFPKVIVNTGKGPDGKEKSVSITFDKITVNEEFPDSIFVIPSLSRK